MYRPTVRGSVLPLIALVALATSLSVPSAQAASSARARFIPPSSVLAPCTKPLYAPNRNCESTSPKVDRWWMSTKAASSCTYRFTVNWDDGTSSTRTFVDEPVGVHLIASHTYHGYTEYSEVVTSTVTAGDCTPVPPTYFEITHLPSSLPSFLEALGIPTACFDDFIPNPADLGLNEIDLGDVLGLYKIGTRLGLLFKVTKVGGVVYMILFELPFDCAVKADAVKADAVTADAVTADSSTSLPGIIGPLPRAYAYGARHPGKLFKPPANVPRRPVITGISGYQSGSLVYFTIFFTNPGKDAKGFGFAGINGAGWAEENHPFSKPSYGVVGHDEISYPFNLACGTAEQYKSYVAAWIYNKADVRSQDVEITLTCTP